MSEVELPTRATITESYQLIEACSEMERAQGPAKFDCTNVERFGPFGIALLASSIAMCRFEGRSTELVLPKSPTAMDFVCEVGLDRFARGERTGLGTLEVRQMHALDAVYSEAVTDMLLRGVPGMTEDSSYSIQLCLNELLQNVFEWAHAGRLYRVCQVVSKDPIGAACRRGSRDRHSGRPASREGTGSASRD